MSTEASLQSVSEPQTPIGETRQDLADVGPAIRELRKSRGVTLSHLSSSIGRSIGFISEIERGLTEPTLKDIYAIAEYFGVPISWFFDAQPPNGDGEQRYIVRAGRRRWMENGGIRIDVLSPQLGQGIEFMMSTYRPLAETKDASMGKVGKEAGVVVLGTLELWIDGDKYFLEKGDSYSLDLTQRFYTRNPSKFEETILYWTVSY